MTALVTFINARGQEIVLDDLPRTFAGELYGRQGFEAPKLKYAETRYGSGAAEVLSVELEPREVTLFFWIPTGTPELEARFERLKAGILQIGRQTGDWGTLRIAKKDGSFADLNCVYTGGLDDTVRESWSWVKFALTFRAADPLFYDLSTTVTKMSTYSEGDRLVFRSTTHFGENTHFRSSDANHEETIEVTGFRTYPDITITGPAANIRIINTSTGRTIRLDSDFALLPGESLEIHTRPNDRSAWWHRQDHTTVKALRYLTADSTLDWYLTGGENVLQFRNTILSPLSICTLSYRAGFLSAG